MLFTKARLVAWGIKALGVIALSGGIWFAGQNFGLDRGFDIAYDKYKKELDNNNKMWYNTLNDRDEEWQEKITNAFNTLEEQFARYREVERRERELLEQITVLETTLLEIENDYKNTDFGLCDLSPYFDGVLIDAHKATTTGLSNPPLRD